MLPCSMAIKDMGNFWVVRRRKKPFFSNNKKLFKSLNRKVKMRERKKEKDGKKEVRVSEWERERERLQKKIKSVELTRRTLAV